MNKACLMWQKICKLWRAQKGSKSQEERVYQLVITKNVVQLTAFLKRRRRKIKYTNNLRGHNGSSGVSIVGAALYSDDESLALTVVELLLAHPVSIPPLNMCWYDSSQGGRQSPLSKALALGYYDVAKLLLCKGANSNILLTTDALSQRDFDPAIVSWLIDHSIAYFEHNGLLTSNTIAHIVQECFLEALYAHYNSKLDSYAKLQRLRKIYENTKECIRRLIAAGATPLSDPLTCLRIHPCLRKDSLDWRWLTIVASTTIQWCPETNYLFPTDVRRGIKDLLLLNHRLDILDKNLITHISYCIIRR